MRIVYGIEDGEDKTIFIVVSNAKEFLVKRFFHNGISTLNVDDFMRGEDAKYELEDYHIIELLKDYHIQE